MKIYQILLLVAICCFISCKDDNKNGSKADLPRAIVPRVDMDSAFSFVEKQLSFGVRVPGTEGHKATKVWISEKMKLYGAEVEIQEFKASFLHKKDIPAYNIIAKINPEQKKRIILFAHWDTRLIAEKDSSITMRDKPIPGAIDGASGVAGLLEIARLIHQNPINLGVDFVFFDAEDQGSDGTESWCLGSQYWAKSIKDQKNKPSFGILLDLIGAKGATYGKEAISTYYAKEIVDKVWRFAAGMGKGQIFMDYEGGQITDDHYYVNKIGGIPTIDIIETKPSGNFGSYHHTHQDNIEAIDKTNLAAVIQVVTAVTYKVSDETF